MNPNKLQFGDLAKMGKALGTSASAPSTVKPVKARTEVEKNINPKGMPKSSPDFESESDYAERKR